MKTTKEKIFGLVSLFSDPVNFNSLTEQSLLLEDKIIDSFGIIQLVVEIDREFSISIKTEDLTMQNFGSITDIALLVNKYIYAE